MRFRKKYSKVFRKNLFKDKNFYWCLRQFKNAPLIPLTVLTKKCFAPPILSGLVLTYRCNMRCAFCKLTERANAESELSEKEFKKVISDFSSLGATGLGFTGGEPLLREDVFTLIRYTKDNKLTTQLTTNGILLNEVIGKKLIDAGLDDLGVSLESHLHDIHDGIRAMSGSWQRTIKGLEAFIKARDKVGGNTEITISTVINRKNFDHIEKLIEFCKDIGIDNISFGIVQEEFAKDEIGIIDQERYRELIKLLIEYAQNEYMVDNSIEYLTEMLGNLNRGRPCWAGYHSIYVDCYGNIFPCFYYMEKNLVIGNIRNISVEKMWKSRDCNTLRKQLFYCHKCFFICQMELNALFNKFNFFYKT